MLRAEVAPVADAAGAPAAAEWDGKRYRINRRANRPDPRCSTADCLQRRQRFSRDVGPVGPCRKEGASLFYVFPSGYGLHGLLVRLRQLAMGCPGSDLSALRPL